MTEDTSLRRPRVRLGLAAAALLVVGGGAGALAGHAVQPAVEMAPMRPVAIRALADGDGIVTVRGHVAEIFGNKYVLDDGSGRALVETGRAGEDVALARIGQPATAQGRFEHGFLHAAFWVDAADKVTALRPVGPPHGPHERGDRRGPPPPPGAGPDRDDGPPPPPAGPAPPAATVPAGAPASSQPAH